ncbi:MAG TPA: hypothetical protein VMT18_10055 [Planctomycetota bacterium]|nr:hypothetical protein [Planctomycetota bacterium]
MPVLESLLLDDESTIYLEAIDILVEILNSFPALEPSIDTLRSLTDHPDARMRRLLPRGRVSGQPDARILEALADDEDADVRFAVDNALREASKLGPYPQPDRPLKEGWKVFLQASSPWTDEFLPALVRRLSSSANLPDSLGEAPFVACHTAAGARALAEVARNTKEEGIRLGLVHSLSAKGGAFGSLRGWHLVEPDLAREVLSRSWQAAPDAKQWASVTEAFRTGPTSYQTACLGWSADESLPWAVRLLALYVSEPLADDAWCARLRALLATTPELEADVRSWFGVLNQLGRELPGREIANRFLADLVSSDDVPDSILPALLNGVCLVAVPDSETARRALERWADADDRFVYVVMRSLEHVVVTEERPELELFERLLRLDGEEYARGTLRAMGRLQLRAHLSLLERTLLGEFGADVSYRTLLQQLAAQSLSCYLDDQAAELLLRGAGSASESEVRDACFEALDTIRRYQDERARWNSRAGSAQARTDAIAELVGLIEHGEGVQKVEAVRALGTLQAVEELPRLVRLTGSKDAALAKAAKESLDAIRAAQVPKD